MRDFQHTILQGPWSRMTWDSCPKSIFRGPSHAGSLSVTQGAPAGACKMLAPPLMKNTLNLPPLPELTRITDSLFPLYHNVPTHRTKLVGDALICSLKSNCYILNLLRAVAFCYYNDVISWHIVETDEMEEKGCFFKSELKLRKVWVMQLQEIWGGESRRIWAQITAYL